MDDVSAFSLPQKKEEAIARSLMSGSLESDSVTGLKRIPVEGLPQGRTKKKKTAQKPAVEMRTAAMLQSLVPKMGPVVCIKPQDTDQLKKAIEGVRSKNRRSVEMGLNYLLPWSLMSKEMPCSDSVLRVMTVLIDFVLRTVAFEPQSMLSKLESNQHASLVSESMMQSMAACLILKNISIALEKRPSLGSTAKKIVQLSVCLLTGKVNEEDGVKTVDTSELPYSMIRDGLHLLKTLSNLEGMDDALLNGLLKMLHDGHVPLRLRITLFDILSVFLYQESIKASVLGLLKAAPLEMEMTLKSFMMMSSEKAKHEAQFEFEGGMDYEGIAVLGDHENEERPMDLKLWSERLRSEALLSAVTFLSGLASTGSLATFAADHFILQSLVDLTTGKKFMDMDDGEKVLLDSKHPVVSGTRRNIRSSEMQTYRMILDALQTSAPMKQKLKKFEEQFVMGAFDNTWQAKQCAMVLSMMNEERALDN